MAELGQLCHACRGVGTVPGSDIDPTPQPCLPCNGTGYEAWGMISIATLEAEVTAIKAKTENLPDNTESLLDDIKDLCQEIKDVVDAL